MKHKLLSTAAVLLLVLLTWSCTTDNDPVPAPVTSAPRELSISIGPRPAYTAGATLPATVPSRPPTPRSGKRAMSSGSTSVSIGHLPEAPKRIKPISPPSATTVPGGLPSVCRTL